ncbi:MAG: glycoside hydrolase family 92 protein, partial [Arenibacter algicola]|nr:glycoside hydrolase family 92 protein [Arenibacter algicola]
MKINQASIFFLLLLTIFTFNSCKEIQSENPKPDNFVDLVYPQLDSENSRWFFFSSASRPFGMVNLSPDTEIDGAWGSGYRHKTDTIKGFSHVHGWQISGLSVMPVSITSENETGVFKDFYSKFNHQAEKASPGYHLVDLERYGISAELTSTKRVGFHKYSFPSEGSPAILFNLNTLLGPSENVNGKMEKIGNKILTCELEMSPTHRRPKPFKLFFKIELNSEISAIDHDPETGNYLVFMNEKNRNVLMKASISYTSVENAKGNMDSALKHWDFQKVV